MLFKVTKRADDFTGIAATLVKGAASVSVVCGERWGHFRKTGAIKGVFVIEPAANARLRKDLDFHPVREETPGDETFIEGLRGKAWRPWHTCFSVLEGLWQTKKTS